MTSSFSNVVVAGTKFWKFDPMQKPPVKSTYPKPISNWDGIPDNLDAALHYTNGYTYFFKDGNYYRFNDRTFAVSGGGGNNGLTSVDDNRTFAFDRFRWTRPNRLFPGTPATGGSGAGPRTRATTTTVGRNRRRRPSRARSDPRGWTYGGTTRAIRTPTSAT